MTLLVYNAEEWNIDAENIPLRFILMNHWPPDSPLSTFQPAFARNVDVRRVNRKILHFS
jgi:hypothetical protein